MIPEGRDLGPRSRAALTALALGVTCSAIYAIFSSGFGRPVPRTPGPAPVPLAPALAVITDDLWLTYLPPGLERDKGGALIREPGVESGGWARYGTPDGLLEARVERGPAAATWDGYRRHLATRIRDALPTVLRGRPALAGRHPDGGRTIAWLERPGTGAWIHVSDSLARELAVIAASAKTPVGD
jgi:hypothetical protein